MGSCYSQISHGENQLRLQPRFQRAELTVHERNSPGESKYRSFSGQAAGLWPQPLEDLETASSFDLVSPRILDIFLARDMVGCSDPLDFPDLCPVDRRLIKLDLPPPDYTISRGTGPRVHGNGKKNAGDQAEVAIKGRNATATCRPAECRGCCTRCAEKERERGTKK